MKSFWWFKENSIAGMARPGFNKVHWFDLPFDEAVALGWIGLHSSGASTLTAFRKHLETYVPKIFRFHKFDDVSGKKALEIFNTESGMLDVANRIAARTNFIDAISIDGDTVHFKINQGRLEEEVKFFKSKGIHKIVTLTEQNHGHEILAEHFGLHHIAIEDMAAPTIDQAQELADIFTRAEKDKERVAVHCLAGIGRTSTMIVAAHILNGENPKEMKVLIAKQNPRFIFTGPQAEFIEGLTPLR